MRRGLAVALLLSMLLSFGGCSSLKLPGEKEFSGKSSSEEAAGSQVTESAEEAPATNGIETVKLGETVTATTEYGDFDIAVIGAVRTDWHDEDDGCSAVSIRLEVKNISYVSTYAGDVLYGYDLDSRHIFAVKDESEFNMEFCDVTGPTDGAYGVSTELPIGEKARMSFPYIVPDEVQTITVVINNQYQVDVEIES